MHQELHQLRQRLLMDFQWQIVQLTLPIGSGFWNTIYNKLNSPDAKTRSGAKTTDGNPKILCKVLSVLSIQTGNPCKIVLKRILGKIQLGGFKSTMTNGKRDRAFWRLDPNGIQSDFF